MRAADARGDATGGGYPVAGHGLFVLYRQRAPLSPGARGPHRAHDADGRRPANAEPGDCSAPPPNRGWGRVALRRQRLRRGRRNGTDRVRVAALVRDRRHGRLCRARQCRIGRGGSSGCGRLTTHAQPRYRGRAVGAAPSPARTSGRPRTGPRRRSSGRPRTGPRRRSSGAVGRGVVRRAGNGLRDRVDPGPRARARLLRLCLHRHALDVSRGTCLRRRARRTHWGTRGDSSQGGADPCCRRRPRLRGGVPHAPCPSGVAAAVRVVVSRAPTSRTGPQPGG